MITTISTWKEFEEQWMGVGKRHNLLLRGELFPYRFSPPPLQRVIEEVRRDEKTRVLKKATDLNMGREHCPEFKDMPIEEAMRADVAVAHFESRDFAGPGQVFEGLNDIFDQWYESLAAHGFSHMDNGAQRAFFYSQADCNTGYHFDSSYVLACQVEGRKRFCWLKDPERWCNRDVIYEQADFYELMSRPDGITPDDVIECEMGPGDVLWNMMLTPHWVYSLDEPTYSFNLTHFNLRHNGELSPTELMLQEIHRERAAAKTEDAEQAVAA